MTATNEANGAPWIGSDRSSQEQIDSAAHLDAFHTHTLPVDAKPAGRVMPHKRNSIYLIDRLLHMHATQHTVSCQLLARNRIRRAHRFRARPVSSEKLDREKIRLFLVCGPGAARDLRAVHVVMRTGPARAKQAARHCSAQTGRVAVRDLRRGAGLVAFAVCES